MQHANFFGASFLKKRFNCEVSIYILDSFSVSARLSTNTLQQSRRPSYLSPRPACCADGRDVAGCCRAPWRFRWLPTCCRKFCYISPLCKYKEVGWGVRRKGRGGKERGGRVACANSCSRSRAVPVTFHNFFQTDAVTKGTTCAADVQCAAAGQL